jgi:hypothetical protein
LFLCLAKLLLRKTTLHLFGSRTSKSESYNADIMLSSAAYCVVAVESVGQQMPIAFLVRIKDDFSKRYGGGKAATAAASSLNREFGYVLLPVWGLLEYMAFYFC